MTSVIVPVFNGHEVVRRCLASVERHTPAQVPIVIVDDASTDPRVPPLLAGFASRRAGTTVLRNPANLGFVGAVNRAIAATRDDVAILNSDTVVTAGWLEGLERCLCSDDSLGIACPLSNNATILSIPTIASLYTGNDGAVDVDAIAACLARVTERAYPRIPTAVGFCMLVARRVIVECGGLDPVYARGYGEECDLSMRALDQGFAIACCDDVYVHHAGEGSFGAVAGVAEQRRTNALVLDRRWPMYSPGVAAWGRANPLRRIVERMTAAAERERMPGRVRVLQVLHRLESRGGIEEHVRSLVNELKGEVAFTLVLPDRAGGAWTDFTEERPVAHLRVLRMNPDLFTPGVEVIGHRAQPADESVEQAFRQLLAGGFDIVHFQSLVGWNTLRLPAIAREAGARVSLTMHDLSLQCADYNLMLGTDNVPCGRGAARASDEACVPCLRQKSRILDARNGPPSISGYIESRHAVAASAVAAADAIVCPSAYSAERLERGFGPGVRPQVRVIGHGVAPYELAPRPARSGTLRVVCLGTFAARKGALAVIEAARRVVPQGVAVESWGAVEPGLADRARAAGIVVRGPYDAARLPEVLRQAELVIVPSVMEESFCLVVSEAQRVGVPVAASERGAIPERVREGETGFLFPPGDVEAMVALLLRLREDRAALEAVAHRLRTERPRTARESAAEYLALYRELASIARGAEAIAPISHEGRVEASLGLPRARTRTPLGTDAYDAWIAAEGGREPGPPIQRGRIRVLPFPQELSEAAIHRFNGELERAGVEWVVLLEPGDSLAPGAMEAFAAAAQRHPDATILYASEDAASAAGERYDPLFKPGFDVALLAHRPYIAGACALHRARVLDRDGLKATGWMGVIDLALNLAKEGRAGDVVAIPGILVHRLDTNLRVLDDPAWLAAYRERVAAILGAQRAPSMPVAVLLRNAASPGQAVACIESLLASLPERIGTVFLEVEAVACAAIQQALAARGREARCESALGSGPVLATLLRRAETEWVMQVDAGCGPFAPGWIDALIPAMADPKVAAVAPDLATPGGAGIAAWEIVGGGPWSVAGEAPAAHRESRLAILYHAPRTVSALSSRLILLRREAALRDGSIEQLAATGPFEIAHVGLALQEAGWTLRSDPAFAARWQGEAAPVTRVPPEASWMRGRWGARLEQDRHFHPQLARTGPEFGPAPRFPRREAAAPRVRICAFPFDRWGSGALRVRQPCEALVRAGDAHVLVMPEHDAGSAPNRLEWEALGADTLFAHNFLHDYQLNALAEYAKCSTTLRVLGLDDLLTDIPPGNPYAATIYGDIGDRIARAARLCDRLVVSTDALAEAYGALAPEVMVIPNAIDPSRWAGLDDVSRGISRRRDSPRPRVGWAGARQHLDDLRLLEPVMRATHGELDWVFLGQCAPELREMAAEVHPMVPVARYPRRLAELGLDVAVAPLIAHPFNEAKSALKVLEYGALGLPVIASDIRPYRGLPVTFARNADDWIEAVRALAHDRDRAREAGAALRAYVIAQATLDARMPAWRRALGVERVAGPRQQRT